MFNWERVITQLFARLDGPLHFRFIMQPLMAAILATIRVRSTGSSPLVCAAATLAGGSPVALHST